MKKILILMILFVYMFSVSYAFFEDRLQCNVKDNYIQVSLGKGDKLKCMDYINTLDISNQLLYKDLLIVQKYIDNDKDVVYRKGIYENIKNHILDNQNLKENILNHMQNFEDNLFKKLKEYILHYIDSYRKKISLELDQFNKYDFSNTEKSDLIINIVKYKIEIENNLEIISQFENTTNFAELVPLLPKIFEISKKNKVI